jgi:gamma-glutamyltranspeptidase/glutathione hydrolase
MVMKDGKPHTAYGVMGGQFQAAGHVLVLSNMLDYGMDAQEAIDSPRIFYEGGTLWCEDSVPESVFQGLAKLGQPVARKPEPWGGSQMVMLDHANGTVIGASDPRKDGMAIGY